MRSRVQPWFRDERPLALRRGWDGEPLPVYEPGEQPPTAVEIVEDFAQQQKQWRLWMEPGGDLVADMRRAMELLRR